jgi:hypothetical protein
MELLSHYELILKQALRELGPVRRPKDVSKVFEVEAVAAPELGDIIYRLCIEHGVAYTPFRETVIKLLSDAAIPSAPMRRDSTPRKPFALRLSADHTLILLALELMPPDMPC